MYKVWFVQVQDLSVLAVWYLKVVILTMNVCVCVYVLQKIVDVVLQHVEKGEMGQCYVYKCT